MAHLFLASSFADVAQDFAACLKEPLTGKTVTFIPTASKPEDITFYVENDLQALKELGLCVEILDIEQQNLDIIKETLYRNDYIFVAGGNTFYLLQALRQSGADQAIKDLILQGKLYIGSSAGAIVLSAHLDYITALDDRRKAPDLTDLTGLGIVQFAVLPHFSDAPFATVTREIFEQYHSKLVLLPINNQQFMYLS